MLTSHSTATFESPIGASWGTFRCVAESWSDEEVSNERYEVSFVIEES